MKREFHECDRCHAHICKPKEIVRYGERQLIPYSLTATYPFNKELCSSCWELFQKFMEGK